jgi:O-antigen biosynthesis protein
MNNPNISIIIVSYNVWEYLDKCIRSILLQEGVIPEIIVVDNNSSDGTVQNLETRYPQLKCIANKTNAGFSGANNKGIQEASADIIMLLNPDTEISNIDTLQKMRAGLLSDSQTGILAPKLTNTDGSFQPSFWPFPGVIDIFMELFYLHLIKKKEEPLEPKQIEAAAGAALYMRKELAIEVGGMDANMFWMEDTDLCYRVALTGKKIIYDPNVKIIHHGGKSSENNYHISIPNQVISKIKYFRKNGSCLQFITSNILSLLFIISRLMIFGLLSIGSNNTYILKRKAYYQALASYFRYNFSEEKGIIR